MASLVTYGAFLAELSFGKNLTRAPSHHGFRSFIALTSARFSASGSTLPVSW
jgi:hypothetical protein